MSAILLRTLTKKSTLTFGKYANDTIGKLLELKKGAYLAWCYYNLSNISFTEDILTELDLEHRIPKPGKDVEYYDKNKTAIGKKLMEVLSPKDLRVKAIQYEKSKKERANRVERIANFYNRAGRNQMFNQNKHR